MLGHAEPSAGYVSRIAAALAAVLLIAGAPSLVLAASDAPAGDVELTGRLVDEDTGEPVPNATMVINNRAPGPAEDTRQRLETGTDGSFNTSLSAGHVFLFVHDQDGYKDLRASFEIRNDTHVELPLLTGDEEPGTIEGRVVDAGTRQAIPDAYVRAAARPQDGGCADHPCDRERPGTEHREQTITDSNGDELRLELEYRSQLDPYQSTRTDDAGRFSFQVPAGTYEIHARAEEHVGNQTTTTLAEGESQNVSVRLTPLPAKTVEIRGQITQDDSGDPIPYAEIEVRNQKWGTHESTRANEDGHYSVSVRPGYLSFRVEADKHYRAPCPENRDDAGDAHPRGTPEDRDETCPPHERETRFFEFARSFAANGNETRTIDVELKAPPAPNASLDGWVVNATNGEPIESANVLIYHQWTGDRGHAETGENGSFRIPARPGTYEVRVRSDGYHHLARTLHVPEDGKRVTLDLEPGQSRRDGCCRAYAETAEPRPPASSGETDDAGDSGSSSEGSGTSSTMHASDGARAQSGQESSFAFQGGPGELGSPPTEQRDASEPGNTTPGLGPLLLSALLGLAATSATRRET